MLNENMEKPHSTVNEEYERQESSEGCCCSSEGSRSCCSGENKGNTDHQCNCKDDDALDGLRKELEEAREKQEDYLKMAQRIQADFENYKRRNRSALSEERQTAAAEVVEVFLPVLDNLDRAIDSLTAGGADESVIKGIELVRRQFLDTLAQLEVEEIEALGKPFNPEYHNAVGQMEAEEGQEKNTIVMVHQKGYIKNGRVIRYSMVHVAS